MKQKLNFWAHVTVFYGASEKHEFDRRDFDLKSVQRHLQDNVFPMYQKLNANVRMAIVTYDEGREIVVYPKEKKV